MKIDYKQVGFIRFGILFIAVALTINPLTASAATVFTESFGTGISDASNIPNWDEHENGTVAKAPTLSGEDTTSPNGGLFAKIASDSNGFGGDSDSIDGWICRSVNAVGFNDLVLSYYWRGDSGASSSDDGLVQYKTSGSCSDTTGWNQLKNHDLSIDSSWSTQSPFSLPVSNSAFLLRFYNSSNSSDEYFRVDGIVVNGSPIIDTATVNVVTNLYNDDGTGTKSIEDFDIIIAGANATPNSFTGNTAVTVDAAAPYVTTVDPVSGYLVSLSPNCANTLSADAVVTCTITVDDLPSTDTDINLIPNPSLEDEESLPTTWLQNQWGTNEAVFTYPVLGSADSPTATSAKAARIELTNHTEGDAKWYFNPIDADGNSDYVFVSRYRSNVPTRVVVATIDSGDNWTFQDAVPVAGVSEDGWKKVAFEFHTPSNAKKLTVFHLIETVGWLEIDRAKLISDEPIQITDLVPNNSVEQASKADSTLPRGWARASWGTNNPTFTYVDGDGHGFFGDRSVKVEVTDYVSGDAKWIFTPQALIPGQDYKFTGWYKTNTIPRVVAQFTKSNGDVSFFGMPNPQPNEDAETEWNKYSNEFSVPSDVVSVSIFFFLSTNGWVQVDDFHIEEYEFPGFDRALVTLTFDDGAEENVTTALPKLASLGFKTTQCYATQYLEDVHPNSAQNKQNVRAFYEAGHEVCAHTITHRDLTSITTPEVDEELMESQAILEETIGIPVRGFASPFGAYSQSVNEQIKGYFDYHRTVDEGYNSPDNLDLYRLRVQNMDPSTTLAEFQSWVDKAIEDKTWLIIVYHKVGLTPESLDTFDTLKVNFDAEMDWLKTRVDAGDITVKRLDDAIAEVTGMVPPAIGAHADVIAEATSINSTEVSYELPVVTDDVDNGIIAACSPASGSLFALGTSTITCDAADSDGNNATSTAFSVIVRDTIAPVIASHEDIAADATSPAGAEVEYDLPDVVDATLASEAVCTPTSGSVFAIGTTIVTCTAGPDAGGNNAEPTFFNVAVTDSAPVISLLGDADITIEYGSTYVDQGATALDAVDGDITDSIAVVNPVNASVLGDYVITYNVSDSFGNHAPEVERSVDVVKRAITVTASDTEKSFGSADPELAFEITDGSLVDGDSFSGALVRETGENVGEYAIDQGTLALSGNYDLTFIPGTFTVSAESSAIEVDNLAHVYDGIAKAVTVTTIPNGLSHTVTYDGSEEVPVNVGSYAVLVTITDPNYSGSESATLVIDPIAITVTADSTVKAFGEADPALTYAADLELIAGNEFSGALAREAGEAIGSYAIEQGTLDIASGNYAIAFVPGTFTIAVDPNNLPPAASSQTFSTYQNTDLNITLEASDDLSAELVWSIVDAPAHGSLAGEAPNLVYSPAADFAGSDLFTFKTNDGNSDSNIATISISVNVEPTCPESSSLIGNECIFEPIEGCPAGSSLETVGEDEEAQLLCVFPQVPFEPEQCEEGYSFVGGQCVAPNQSPVCPAETALNAESGLCETVPVEPVAPTCEAGTYNADTDQCESAGEPICVVGSLNTETDMCEGEEVTPEAPTCAEGSYDAETNQCAISGAAQCPVGELNVETDMCIVETVDPFAPNECPANFSLIEGQCVAEPQDPTCPANSTEEEGMCVPDEVAEPVAPSCPEGTTELDGGMCQPDPVAPVCGANFNLEGAICVAKIDICPNLDGIQETMPDKHHLDNGQCVEDEEPEQSSSRGGGRRRVSSNESSQASQPQVLGASTSAAEEAEASTSTPASDPIDKSFIFSKALTIGSRGIDVTELQKRLATEGFYAGPITGYFGPLTEAAVKLFQAKHGIDPIGYVGIKTCIALNGGFIPSFPPSSIKPTDSIEETAFIQSSTSATVTPKSNSASKGGIIGFLKRLFGR